MDISSLLVMAVIILAIILIDFNRRQKNRLTNHLHNDNFKQFLTIEALKYQLNNLDSNDEAGRERLTQQLEPLIDEYEEGKLSADAFRKQMNNLLQID